MQYAWHFFALFKTLFIVGIILFVVWASKLRQDELKKLVVWLIVGGVVGALLTSAVYPDYKMKRGKKSLDVLEDVLDAS